MNYEEALDCFEKLHAMIPDSADVIFQIAHCLELLGDIPQVQRLNFFLLKASSLFYL